MAPYSGLVLVTANSRALPEETTSKDPTYEAVQRQCELVAKYCGCFSVMRIDARRRSGPGSEFVIFDVNMKPVSPNPFKLPSVSERVLILSECHWTWSTGER